MKLPMDRIESQAERLLTGFVETGRVGQERMRIRVKRIALVAIFLAIAGAMFVGTLRQRRTGSDTEAIILAAADLIQTSTCEVRAGATLTICVDPVRWQAADQEVRSAWTLGEYYRHPDALRLRATDPARRLLLGSYDRPPGAGPARSAQPR